MEIGKLNFISKMRVSRVAGFLFLKDEGLKILEKMAILYI